MFSIGSLATDIFGKFLRDRPAEAKQKCTKTKKLFYPLCRI